MIFTISNLTTSYWKQERVVFKGNINASYPVKMWSNLHGSDSTPIATYSPDAFNMVYIDVTDYLRTYNPTIGNSVTLYFKYSNSSYAAVMTNAGLINPESVMIPSMNFSAGYYTIIPPDMMLYAGAFSARAQFEVRWNATQYGNCSCTEYSKEGATLWQGNLTAPTHTLNRNAAKIDLLIDQKHKVINLSSPQCGVKYCMVEWVSFTGATRRHVFEIVKQNTKNENSYNLLPIDNEYIQIKGRVDAFTLQLRDLSIYDLWYYSDIINSSNVRVSLDGTNWDRVEITDKAIKLPDGEAKIDGTLKIALNWKRYDAVAL